MEITTGFIPDVKQKPVETEKKPEKEVKEEKPVEKTKKEKD